MKLRNKLAMTTSIAFGIAILLYNLTIKAQEIPEGITDLSLGIPEASGKFIGAGLAVGLAGFGSSIGMGNASSAAIGAISEDQSLFGTALIFVVLIEAVAIYGLLIALLLIFAA
jgi:F0F1-type ATP synthase membrane subunit c/vacuolar-type H+-ATPase subunit K